MAGPLDRTWYNALVDDDGSNTTGSLWDKADVDSLMDAVDAQLALVPASPVSVANGGTGLTALGTALQIVRVNAGATALEYAAAASGAWTVATTSTLTGAQNNWAPGISGSTYVAWNGASDVAFTGIAGGVAGQFLTVKNITADKIATFAHNSGSSSAGNKLKNFATSAPTPIAPSGFITYQYDGTDWQLVAHEQGAFITAPFAAGDFTADVGTWVLAAGDIAVLAYRLTGRSLTVIIAINTSTTTGSNGFLEISNAQWGGFTVPVQMYIPAYLYDAANVVGMLSSSAAGTKLNFARLDGGAISAATDLVFAKGTWIGQVT